MVDKRPSFGYNLSHVGGKLNGKKIFIILQLLKTVHCAVNENPKT